MKMRNTRKKTYLWIVALAMINVTIYQYFIEPKIKNYPFHIPTWRQLKFKNEGSSKKPGYQLGSVTNRTKNVNILVYNRVPKAGSSTVIQLLRILGHRSNFVMKSSKNYPEHLLPGERRREIVDFLRKEQQKKINGHMFVYEQHFFYFNI